MEVRKSPVLDAGVSHVSLVGLALRQVEHGLLFNYKGWTEPGPRYPIQNVEHHLTDNVPAGGARLREARARRARRPGRRG